MTKLLLFIHLVSAACALATTVHLLLRLWRYNATHGVYVPQIRLHSAMAGGFYIGTFVLGALIYPTFRVEVRAAVFDETMPWLTGLFEMKEHLAALGLMPAIGIIILGRIVDFHHVGDRRYLPAVAGLAIFMMAVVAFNSGAGWYLGSVKSL